VTILVSLVTMLGTAQNSMDHFRAVANAAGGLPPTAQGDMRVRLEQLRRGVVS
jgi:hypothetical protein